MIPRILEGTGDLVGLAHTGTGKTTAFGLPMIQKIDIKNRSPQALVLCPTRELCIQISKELELIEAKDEKSLLRLQKQLARQKLLVIDELGFVPLSKTAAELLFEVFSQRYERASTIITSNLPFDEWTDTFGSERLTGALLDRLTHHVHILEMNGESFRLKQSKKNKRGK